MGLPSALVPENVYFTPSPCASTVRVRLAGAGPGSYLDFVRLSFQDPTRGLLCACKGAEATAANRIIATNIKTCFMSDPPWVRSFIAVLIDFVRSREFTWIRNGENNLRNNMPHRVASQQILSDDRWTDGAGGLPPGLKRVCYRYGLVAECAADCGF